jgi:tetratricopeptide (TPR) repeat protein
LGHERIEWRPPGYVLHVDASDEVDARQFEHLLAASEDLEPAECAAALREGLALWRGAPLADFSFETFAQPEIARLDELRLVAHERRFEAELALGRHEAVLGEIEALAARHPARERLRELQMHALYLAGRQRDALRVYVDARQELVEQFGLEPGDRLRTMERRILAHDPDLLAPAPPQPRRERLGLQRNAVVLLMEIVEPDGAAPSEPFLAEIATIVEHHEGSVRSLRPDEILVVFGPPRPHDDDALRALRTVAAVTAAAPSGCRVRTAVERLAGGANGSPPLEGLRELLAKARIDDLLIGPEALRFVRAAVDVVPHEGGGGYRVLRFNPEAEPFVRYLNAPLVGRAKKLDRLKLELDETAREGAPRRIVLVGEAGIGKTRLAREFVGLRAADAATLSGRCRGEADRAAMLPLLDIIGQLGPLEPQLAAEPDGERILAPLREGSLSVATEVSWAFRRMLELCAADRPLIVLLEDVHLAAPAFLDVIEYLTGWTSLPLLMLCLARPELLDARPDWREDAVFLGPLPPNDAERLVESLPGAVRLDAQAAAAAVTAAEGNPLFIEQLVAFAAGGASAALPPTLEALIASRVDRLPENERRVLEWASVAGALFWRSTVETVSTDEARAGVGAALMALVRRRLVRPERALLPGEDGFRFQHALIHDVVYGGIPERVRADGHEAVGRSLERYEPELDEVVAYHLEQAALLHMRSGDEDPLLSREASRRLGDAGKRAFNRIDSRAAVDLLTRALALLADDDEPKLELECALAIAVKFTGDTARSDVLLEQLAERSAALGNERIELLARVEQVWPRLASGALSVSEAHALLDRALGVFERAGDEFALGRAIHCLAVVKAVYEFRYAELGTLAVRLHAHYERVGFGPAVVLYHLALAAYRGPTPAPAAIERCRRLLSEAGTPVWESFILPVLAVLEAMEGRFDDARALLERARLGREEFPALGSIATNWATLAAEVELLAEHPERAEEILSAARVELRAAGDIEWLATNGAGLAEAQYRLGRYAEALSTSEDALATGPPEHLTSKAVGRRVRAKALARLGRGPRRWQRRMRRSSSSRGRTSSTSGARRTPPQPRCTRSSAIPTRRGRPGAAHSRASSRRATSCRPPASAHH